METDVENAVPGDTIVQTPEQELNNTLQILQQAIANMPEVDAAKVQTVIEKIQNGTLQILGTEQERLESAKRIAAQIMTEPGSQDL